MDNKFYRFYGIDTAMKLLRPEARWEINNNKITVWDDPRPCPTWEEIESTMAKILEFENSIPTIWTDEQIKSMQKQHEIIQKAA